MLGTKVNPALLLARRYAALCTHFAIAAVIVTAILMLASGLRAARAADDSSAVLAEIGSHKITQQEVDARIKVQLYNARRSALDDLVDDYLLQQAARKERLSVSDYLKREVDDKAAANVTDSSARQFYEQNKNNMQSLKRAPYEAVKNQLIGYLRQREPATVRAELLARLREQAGVKVLLPAPRVEVATGDNPGLGPVNTPVTVIEFADFQCPFCGRAEDTVKAMRAKYGDKVRLVFMDFPLSFHANALPAANAARCAGEQNKFWQYHDGLFANQSRLASDDLKATASKIGLDTTSFNACLDKRKYDAAIQHDLAEGQQAGVTGTPTFFINGREMTGAQPLPKFDEIIEEELAQADHGAKQTAAAR